MVKYALNAIYLCIFGDEIQSCSPASVYVLKKQPVQEGGYISEKKVSRVSRYLKRKGCPWLWINFFHKQRALRNEPLSQEQQLKGSGIGGTLL